MKKAILSITGFSSSILVSAQEKPNGNPVQPDLGPKTTEALSQTLHVDVIVPVILVGLLVFWIISLVKYLLEHRLKNKIIDREISEQLATSILEKNSKNKNDEAMKLAILLCSVGTGLMITYCTMPLHIHSLAIIAFSVGAGYLGYFSYLKNQNK